MITHASALEALAEPQAAEAFDFVADARLLRGLPWDNDRLDYHLIVWLDFAVDLSFMLMGNYRLPSSMMPDDGRIAGVIESAAQEKMEL